jgi:transcriptional regulator with PAS, ATPase and Fis domain
LRKRIEEHPAELEQLVSLLVTRATGTEAPDVTDMVVSSLRASLPETYPWPGNVRELEQAVRRILLNGRYDGIATSDAGDDEDRLAEELRDGGLTATELTSRYCRLLYRRLGSYEQVARRIELDRRTVKKYIERGAD